MRSQLHSTGSLSSLLASALSVNLRIDVDHPTNYRILTGRIGEDGIASNRDFDSGNFDPSIRGHSNFALSYLQDDLGRGLDVNLIFCRGNRDLTSCHRPLG